jgi:membrane associated rhomboid family serine protease
MIPVCDVIPSRTTPWITICLIGLNCGVFLYGFGLPKPALAEWHFRAGLVPADVDWTSALTSMFVHEHLLHLTSNVVTLWIFGDNVEDRLGHLRYLVLYLMAGWTATVAEVWAGPSSPVPFVGAGGAVAGVMGAYFRMFPRSRVHLLVPLAVSVDLVDVPAVWLLGVWFMLQVAGGPGRLGTEPANAAVAIWAVAGGFLTGLVAGTLARRPERERVDWWSPSGR